MIRDPFYRQIVEGLGGQLDPELFERCATDLLRPAFPGLVPIRGGTDAGMDGAIPDGMGLPYPLVATTSKDVMRNLTRSLRQYKKEGGTRRSAVVATSRALSSRQRRNLEQRAESERFTLIQTVDQAGIANLLYRDPKWCLELLSLAGNPAPLSVVPRTRRPLLGQALVGRAHDINWLQSQKEDCLLVSEPGCGKTAILQSLAQGGQGLFVVTDDLGEIAAGIRSQQPDALFVDDAHAERELLRDLVRYRAETGAGFRIVATCWPGEGDSVAEELTLTDSSIRHLTRLRRDDIVRIVKGAGVKGPDGLIAAIVNQAEGLAGLATTLAQLCLRGDVRSVVLGDALARSVQTTLTDLIGRDAVTMLAGFALGGDSGMMMNDVAALLDVPVLTAHRIVSDLGAGGVVADKGVHRLAVRPRELRHALVRDTFFRGGASLLVEPFIARAPDPVDVVRTLIGARASGGSVPDALIKGLLEAHSYTTHAWAEYAGLGRNEAEYVLDHHPELLVDIVEPALYWAPERTISMLLDRASGDDPVFPARTNDSITLIERWIEEAAPGSRVAVQRRERLFNTATTWLGEGGNSAVGLRALCIALSPKFHAGGMDPGAGRTFHWREGYLTEPELEQLAALWPAVCDVLKSNNEPAWRHILRLVQAWMFPRLPDGPRQLAESVRTRMRATAVRMMRDSAEIAVDRPVVLRQLLGLARRVGVPLAQRLDTEFETLFPEEPHFTSEADFNQAVAAQVNAVRMLGSALLAESPNAMADRIARYDREAALTERVWPRYTPTLAQTIAGQASEPLEWLRALVEADAKWDVVAPFLATSSTRAGSPEWDSLARIIHGNHGRS